MTGWGLAAWAKHGVAVLFAALVALGVMSASALANVAQGGVSTTIVLSGPGQYVQINAPLKVTATVTASDGTVPTGQVTIIWQNHNTFTLNLDRNGQASTTVNSPQELARFDASYLGSGNYSISSADPLLITVANIDVPTVTTLTASSSVQSLGEPVTLSSFTAAPQLGPYAVGGQAEVAFYDGDTLLGTAVSSDGAASLTTSSLSLGDHDITARYAGDPVYYNPSTSAAKRITILTQKLATTTVLSAPSQQVESGSNFTVSVTVSSEDGSIPNGVVRLIWQGHFDRNYPLDDAGKVTFSSSASLPEAGSFDAQYLGNGAFKPSEASSLPFAVGISTQNQMEVAPDTSVRWQPVTMKATVTPVTSGYSPDGGTVEFFDGTKKVAEGLVSGGTASASFTPTLTGGHSLSARYTGKPVIFASASSPVTLTVNDGAEPTSTALTMSPNPALISEQVALTAQVSGAVSGDPATGVVEFRQAGVPIGTAALNGGTATLTHAFADQGSVSITAHFLGDEGAFQASESVAQSLQVDTSTSVQLTGFPIYAGDFRILTATVTADLGVPQGVVRLTSDNGQDFGTYPVLNGVAQLVVGTQNAPGPKTFRAEFAPSTGFRASDVYVTTEILPQPVTLSATVTRDPTNPLRVFLRGTATNQITNNGAFGTLKIFEGGSQIALSRTGRTITLLFTQGGQHNLHIEFLNGYATASLDYAVDLSASSTVTNLTSSKNPAVLGEAVTLTATVSAGADTPTGTVEFLDGSTSLGSASLSNGVVTLSTDSLELGSHTIVAKYSGIADVFAASDSAALEQSVVDGRTATTTTVTFSPSVIYPADTGVAHIVVSAASGTVTGQVSINIPGQNDRTAYLVNGAADITIPTLFPDTYQLIARYQGTSEFAPSASSPTDYKITKEPTGSSFTTPHVSVFDGTPVNVKAIFTNRFGPAADLIIELRFDRNLTNTLSTANDGSVSTTFTGLAIGDHTVTATYFGNNAYSSSTATMTITVLDPNAVMATSTSLVSSANPSDSGQVVTFTATVVNSVNELDVPTGTVKFIDGADEIGAVTLVNGVATMTVGLPTGGHSITAHYLGKDLYHESASAALTQIISKVSSAVTLTSTANPAQPGQEVTITASVVGGGFAAGGTVRFFDGTTFLTSADVVLGVTSFSTDLLAVGTHEIRAVYSGDDNHEPAEASLQQEISSGDSNLISNIQDKGSQQVASRASELTTDMVSEVIDDALGGQVQVLSASDGKVGLTWAPGLVRGGTRIQPTADVGNGMLTTDSNLRFWMKGRYTKWQGDLEGQQWNGLVGASVLFGDGKVAGLLAGYENYDTEDTAGATLKGDGYSIGGYFGGKLANGLNFDTQLQSTFLGYDVAAGAVTGDFDATRLTAAGGLAYTLRQGAFTFAPTLRASGMWEWQDGYTDSAAVVHGKNSFGNARLSAGARLGYAIPLDGGGSLTPFVSGFGDWRFSEGDGTADSALDGASGRVETGFNLQMGNGVNFSAAAEFMGLGIDETRATSYRANLSIPF